MIRALIPALTLLLLAATIAVSDETSKEVEGTAVAAEETSDSAVESILRALRLPEVSLEARAAGVPEEKIREILSTARKERVPAGDLETILEEDVRAVKEGGPVGNFGAIVQEKLRQGLRGRDLAQALHAEKAALGKGKKRIRAEIDGAQDEIEGAGKMKEKAETVTSEGASKAGELKDRAGKPKGSSENKKKQGGS